MEQIDQSIFKAYDIRGIYPTQINAELVYKIAQAYVKLLQMNDLKDGPMRKLNIAVGHDMRLCGKEFRDAAERGLTMPG